MWFGVALLVVSGVLNTAADTTASRVLTSIAEVRALSLAEASKAHPVELEGVVTYFGYTVGKRLEYYAFLQDSTGGIYLWMPPGTFAVGNYVRVRGQTKEGWFAPDIQPTAPLEVLGQAPMPAPSEAPLYKLLSGEEDAQWVALEGVVRSVGPNTKTNDAAYFITVAIGQIEIDVWVPFKPRQQPSLGGNLSAW